MHMTRTIIPVLNESLPSHSLIFFAIDLKNSFMRFLFLEITDGGVHQGNLVFCQAEYFLKFCAVHGGSRYGGESQSGCGEACVFSHYAGINGGHRHRTVVGAAKLIHVGYHHEAKWSVVDEGLPSGHDWTEVAVGYMAQSVGYGHIFICTFGCECEKAYLLLVLAGGSGQFVVLAVDAHGGPKQVGKILN